MTLIDHVLLYPNNLLIIQYPLFIESRQSLQLLLQDSQQAITRQEEE